MHWQNYLQPHEKMNTLPVIWKNLWIHEDKENQKTKNLKMLENVFIINNSDFFFSFRKSIHIHCSIYILDSDVYPPHLPYCTSLCKKDYEVQDIDLNIQLWSSLILGISVPGSLWPCLVSSLPEVCRYYSEGVCSMDYSPWDI